ncbi:MAG: hypothetical protein WHU10_04780 [Fimbriimonadales bacterium]
MLPTEGGYALLVFWLQGAVSFLIWILYGVGLRRRAERTARMVEHWGHGVRVFAGAACLILSGVLLLAGLAALRHLAGPQPADGMETVPWIAVTLLGILFVELQVLGATIMVSLARPDRVPHGRHRTSKPWGRSRWRVVAWSGQNEFVSKRKRRKP